MIETTASRLELGDAHGLTFPMTNVCRSLMSGTRCFKLAQRDDKARTTSAPRDLENFSASRILLLGKILTIMRKSKYTDSVSSESRMCCVDIGDNFRRKV